MHLLIQKFSDVRQFTCLYIHSKNAFKTVLAIGVPWRSIDTPLALLWRSLSFLDLDSWPNFKLFRPKLSQNRTKTVKNGQKVDQILRFIFVSTKLFESFRVENPKMFRKFSRKWLTERVFFMSLSWPFMVRFRLNFCSRFDSIDPIKLIQSEMDSWTNFKLFRPKLSLNGTKNGFDRFY